MEYRNWNALSLLNCHTESSLSFGSTSLDIDLDLIFQYAFCLIILFLCHQVVVPSLLTYWNTKDSRKRRAKRRRKGGTLTGWSCYQSDKEETRRLAAVVKSPLGRQHDTTRIRQLLCPDPFCEVCNRATAEINQLLFSEALEDSTPSLSPMASTAPMTESSCTVSSDFPAAPPGDQIPVSQLLPSPPPLPVCSHNPLTSLDDFLAPPMGYNLPPEPFPSLGPEFYAGHPLPQQLAFSPLPQYDTQTVDAALQPETPLSLNNFFSIEHTLCQDINVLPNLPQPVNPDDSYACPHVPPTLSVSRPQGGTLTVTQSKTVSTVFKSVPENLSSHCPPGISVPAIRGSGHSSLSGTEYSRWQARATNWLSSTLAPRNFNQEFFALHSSEHFLRGDHAAILTEPGNLSFLSPDALALLERQIQKRRDSLMWKEKENKTHSFPRPLRPGHRLNSSGEMLRSIADKDDSAVSLPFWSSKAKPPELQMHKQPLHLKPLEDHLQQKYTQLFWGLPSLHSESLPSAVRVSVDSPSICVFNGIPNASTGQESPVLSQPISVPFPDSQPPPLPQTPPHSPAMPNVQPQAHLPCPIPAQPSGPSHQIRICGVFFHRPQNEPDSLDSSDIERLEWHLLQKQQENVRGLPAVVQSSHQDFCSSPPDSPQHRATHDPESISSLPGEFPLTDELRNKLEHHLRKRLIQHWWGLPHRIIHLLSLLMPPGKSASELGSSHAPSQITLRQGQSSETLHVGLSPSGSFHETESSVMNPSEKDAGLHQENSPENHSDVDLLNSSDEHLGYESENNLNGHVVSLSGKGSRTSEGSLLQPEMENALKVLLNKKLEEINKRRLPKMVQSSVPTEEQSLHSAKPHSQVGQDDVSSSGPQGYSVNTSQQLAFMRPSTRQLLEAHIKRFRLGMRGGLPSEVLESIEVSKLKDDTPLSLHTSSTSRMTEDSKSGALKSIRRKSRGEENLEITDVGPVQDHQSPCPPAMKCTPVLPARQAVATQEPEAKRMSFNSRAERPQGRERHKNLEMLSKAIMAREISRAEESDAPQSKSSDILMRSKPGSSQTADRNESQVETTRTTERPPPQRAVARVSKSSDRKPKLSAEVKVLRGSGEPRNAPGQADDTPLSLDNSTLKSSLTHAQSIPIGDVVASQVLQAHLADSGVTVGQQQEPWSSGHVFRKCQDKNVPPAAKTVSLPGLHIGEFGGGDTRLGTAQARKQCVQTRKMALAAAHRRMMAQNLAPKRQPPPQNLFRKKINQFLQCIRPVMTGRKQENSQEKGSPISLQGRGLLKSRAALTGMTEAQKIRTDTGKFQERLGYDEAHHSPVTCGRTQQKAKVQTQTEPNHRHPVKCRGPSCKGTHAKSCSQEAVAAGQPHPTSNRCVRHKDGRPQKHSY